MTTAAADLLTRLTEPQPQEPARVFPRTSFRYGFLGPAIVLLAFGQATGELMQWPYLVVKYGTFFVFLLLPACFVQMPIFSFMARHTLVAGETFFSTLLKGGKSYAIFVWVIFVLTSIWISSYTAAGGLSLAKLVSATTTLTVDLEQWSKYIALALNTVFLIILLISRRTYRLIKVIMDFVAGLSFLAIGCIFVDAAARYGGVGSFMRSAIEWKTSLPKSWDPSDSKVLLSAVVFAGLGGLWNALYSGWLRNEGMGMAKYNDDEFIDYQRKLPSVADTPDSRLNFRRSMRLIHVDLLVGIGVNFIMLWMLAYVAFAFYPKGHKFPSGLGIVTVLADSIGYGSTLLAIVAYVMVGLFLMDTWITAADSLSKLHANFLVGLFGGGKYGTVVQSRLWYISALIVMWIMTYVSTRVGQPQQLIFLNGVLSGLGSVLLIGGILLNERAIRKANLWLRTPRWWALGLGVALIAYVAIGIAYMFVR